ncbi:MAG: hypothetical protein KA818_07930 [Methanoculleus sp.]|nr:hypothetical protein [Methanoculleus sp.]
MRSRNSRAAARPPYAVSDLVRDLYRRREETIVRKETDTIEDEIALGLYDDEDL